MITNRRFLLGFFLITLFCLSQPIVLCAQDYDDFDELVFDWDECDFDMNTIQELESTRDGIDPARLMDFVKNQKCPLWRQTRAPAARDILYSLPHKITAIEYGGLATYLFFNFTNHMRVSVDDLFSGRNQRDFLDAVLPSGSRGLVEQVLPLFRKIKIQDRKLGLLFQSGFVKSFFTVHLHTSLQVAERNFWLNGRDQNILRDLFADLFPGDSTFDEREFVRFRVGLGDTRLKFGVNMLNMSNFQLDAGLEGIFPTSRLSAVPRFRTQLTGELTPEALTRDVTQTLFGIRDYLIDPRLGNGNFAFGPYFEAKVDLFHELARLWVRLSFDKSLKKDEDRLIMFAPTMTAEEYAKEFATPDGLANFLTQYLKEYIFPSSFKATVNPGGIFNLVVAVNINLGKKYRYTFGYDFYGQQNERITMVHNTAAAMNELRVVDATRASVSQHKLFSESMYIKRYKRADVAIGYGFDATWVSRGIGKDWTIFLKGSASF
ncbi:MAG: hypothetical protein H6679_03480 [Epsilonproteobacteria bacterium]|nr:hypothetical protein [Campylobacterota bacterium]